MPGLSCVLAPSEAEAIAKDEALVHLADDAMGIEYLSESLGFDLSGYDPAGPIPVAAILAGTEFPPDDIAKPIAAGAQASTSLVDFARTFVRVPRGHHVFRGTPEQMADMMQAWLEQGACDGFTLQPAICPPNWNCSSTRSCR